jgi:hypothetical protein
LPEQPVKPVDRVLAAPGVAQAFAARSDSPSASSSSRITSRPPSELSCAPRNSTCTRRSNRPDLPASNPHPLGDPSNAPHGHQHHDLYRKY